MALLVVAGLVAAQPASEPMLGTPASGSGSAAARSARLAPMLRSPAWVTVPRVRSHLVSTDLGLVINTADRYSVEVGAIYVAARHLKLEQVLRVELPVKPVLTAEEFATLSTQIQQHFGPGTQALALTWTFPYAVNCNAITAAVTLGYDPLACRQLCAPSRPSPYLNSASARPFTDLKIRPSMLLAAASVADARAMIERGVASDHTLGLRGAPAVNAYFVATTDKARNVRAAFFPPPGLARRLGVDVHVASSESLDTVDRAVLFLTGAVRVERLEALHFVPGALADHLTSFGGQLDGRSGQMMVTDWLSAGATASYGIVSEPCAHPQKFPHPQLLLQHYAQGATAIEAYWKSVAWPQQGLFVGEPLATPFSRR